MAKRAVPTNPMSKNYRSLINQKSGKNYLNTI